MVLKMLLRTFFIFAKLLVLVSCWEKRIRNGDDIGDKDFSFTAIISNQGKQVCSGVLVDSQWVVTLKSCFDESEMNMHYVLFQPNALIETPFKKYGLVLAKVIDDIIMFKLEQAVVKKEDGIRIFNRFSTKDIDAEMTDCKVVGFSRDAELVETEIVFKNTDICFDENKRGQLCFDTLEGVGKVCKEDNGAPILCKQNNKWHLYGFSSLEKGCTQTNILGLQISTHRKKIQNVIDEKKTPADVAQGFYKWGIYQYYYEDTICLTEACYSAAEYTKNVMDSRVNPCDDFYNFACGGWMLKFGDEAYASPRVKSPRTSLDRIIARNRKTTRRDIIAKVFGEPNEVSRFRGREDPSSFTLLYYTYETILDNVKSLLEQPPKEGELDAVRKTKQFYQSCVDTNNIDAQDLGPVHKVLESFGGLPVLGKGPGGMWNSNRSLEDILIDTTPDPFLYSIFFYKQVGRIKMNTLFILEPLLTLYRPKFYLNGRDDGKIMLYQSLLMNMYFLLGATEEDSTNFARKVVDFEIDLANITTEDLTVGILGTLTSVTVGQLNSLTDLDLKKIFQKIAERGGNPIDDSVEINVYLTEYFSRLGDVLQRHEKSVIVTYIVGHWLINKLAYLPGGFRYLDFVLQQLRTGVLPVDSDRWFVCFQEVDLFMKDGLSRIFVDEYFSKKAKEEVEDMFVEIKRQHKKLFKKSAWLASITKTKFKKKLRKMAGEIGYDEKLYDKKWMRELTKHVDIRPDTPLHNVLALDHEYFRRGFSSIGKAFDTTTWEFAATTVNAFQEPYINQIYLFAGMMQPPVYDYNYPSYMKFSSAGYILGHEVAHAFGINGIENDKNGLIKEDWSTEDDLARFNEEVQCLIDQYSNYTIPGTDGYNLNGKQTVNEDISDLIGMKLAYKAYLKWKSEHLNEQEGRLPGLQYNNQEMFFISIGQFWCEAYSTSRKIQLVETSIYSLGRYRTIGPLQNNNDFSKVWNCPAESYMNPNKKCSFW